MIEYKYEIAYLLIFSLSFIIPLYISLKIEKYARIKDTGIAWFIVLTYNTIGIVIVWIINWNILGYIVYKILK